MLYQIFWENKANTENSMINEAKKKAASRKLRRWQKELDKLTESTGITLKEVSEYLGINYKRDIGFYTKIPMKRRTIIGIGMAFHQPLEVINRWIVTYSMKRRLYSKDISGDMIWIYLINLNCKKGDSGRNYFREYEEFQEEAFETYLALWSEISSGSVRTDDVDEQLRNIGNGEDAEELKNFVINNIDSFKNAYAKPRKMLSQYVECILKTNGMAGNGQRDSLISLRGWLDDSMINYLCGSSDTINVMDIKTHSYIADIKHIPKSRKSHISLVLALGMTREEIDKYLELMGYLPLAEDEPDEEVLVKELQDWDEEHPLQRKYKEKVLHGNSAVEMTPEDELEAVSEMLMLRQDLNEQYKRRKLKFAYSKL